MTNFSVSADCGHSALAKLGTCSRRYFDLEALFRRVERFDARRSRGRTGAVTSSPRRLDAELLEHGRAFEAAWACELTTLIEMKKLKTPESEAAARAARAATAAAAARIEATCAITLDGLKVKARAILWRRNGEPLGTIGPEDRSRDDAQLAKQAPQAA